MARKKTKHEAHGELKERVTLSLTPTARERLDEQAKALGLSRSEAAEQLLRRGEGLPVPEAETQLLGECFAG
jgi:hypothetical protein